MPLTVTVIQPKPGAVTLAPVGSVDSDTYRILETEIGGVLTDAINTLVLDLAAVDFISSAGIGAVLKAKQTLTKRGADLAMINLKPQVNKAFEIMNLLPTLNVFESEEELDEYLVKVQQRIIDGDEGV